MVNMPPESEDTSAEPVRYVLSLYVAGASARSMSAIANVKALCEKRLRGLYDLRVIDIYHDPVLAQDDQVVAVPMLVKQEPHPVRRMIGDMYESSRLSTCLGLPLK
jgi:circadian clock protein KaiB